MVNDLSTWQIQDEVHHPLSKAQIIDFYDDLAASWEEDRNDAELLSLDFARACPYPPEPR